MKLLILGGTTEASSLARALANRTDLEPILSLAGRTMSPALPPIPHRVGGFGGVAGLAGYLRREAVDAVVDATHPFAARISANAAEACTTLGLPLMVFSRPPWFAGPHDDWTFVADMDEAARALGDAPRHVLLTVGRLDLAAFKAMPQHHYLVRTIDPPQGDDLPPDHMLIVGRGPFRLDEEQALMRDERIEVLVTKNSGGTAAAAKLEVARMLGVPVIVVERPPTAATRNETGSLAEVLDWIEARRRTPPLSLVATGLT
ncbi:MAG: cobalt-precorrin-6A reductase [Janthinobacterium lividum]